MLVACWSVKGGSGTTVVATALALLLARAAPSGVLLVDLGGDVPAALGVPDPETPGVADWIEAVGDADALGRLAVDVGESVHVLPRGTRSSALATFGAPEGERLAAALHEHPQPVVVDCGPPATGVGTAVAGSAPVSLLVLRPCFLALRRAVDAPMRPSSVVLVEEPGHLLRPRDVSAVLGVPVGARIPWDPAVARGVDGGLLPRGLPRALERALREAA
ncbi:MAG TPA: hypothetical protein VHF47_05450 [Acidimicrobiales bacterium]|nr:hypothetical protein [Acidimicrobiales bacterium]